MSSGFGIAFDGAGLWNFGNDFARNVKIFDVHDGSSSHTDNSKNNFLILAESPTYGINESFGWPKKKFGINFSKKKTKLTLKVYIKIIKIVLCFPMEKKSWSLKL